MAPCDICILGTGVVSRTAALALARAGFQVALQARRPIADTGPDVRAYALNAVSVELLAGLRVWDALPVDARTAVLDMRVEGDAAGAVIEFSAWTQAVAALAHIVDAAALEATLESAVGFTPQIRLLPQADLAMLSGSAAGSGRAALTVVAEGKASALREQLGAAMSRFHYGHSALAARLVADRPHAGLARQWFRSPDVLALLPFDRPTPGQSYGLVWSLPEADAQVWLGEPPDAVEAALYAATAGAAGRLRLDGVLSAWPLSVGSPSAVSGPGWVLVGDAAHVVHPLAGQGLNLGLRDVVALVDVLRSREAWRGLGDEALLRRYARQRLAAHWAMARITDGLWQLFATPSPGLRELRNRGLTLLNHLSPVKRWLVGRALGA